MKTAEEYLPAESDLAFEGGIMPLTAGGMKSKRIESDELSATTKV